jgi:hypothetical protein
MSLSSEALLDHIADFLKFISSTQLFWFSIDTSYDDGCHLASRFRLDPDEYQALLIVASLASHTRFGFQINAGAWRKFLGGHRFAIDNCAIEFEQKKIDLDAYAYIDFNEGSYMLLELGIKVSNLTTKLRNRLAGMGD